MSLDHVIIVYKLNQKLHIWNLLKAQFLASGFSVCLNLMPHIAFRRLFMNYTIMSSDVRWITLLRHLMWWSSTGTNLMLKFFCSLRIPPRCHTVMLVFISYTLYCAWIKARITLSLKRRLCGEEDKFAVRKQDIWGGWPSWMELAA